MLLINNLNRQQLFIFASLAVILLIILLYRTSSNDTFSISSFYLKHNKPIKSDKNKNYEKWIVVTTINQPTEQCKKLSKTDGFHLLVVGDAKTNNNWSLNNSLYLSLQDQSLLDFKSFKTTPLNSYTRKNIGYLFAINYGAKFIYDTDDDNAPLVDLQSYFNFEQSDLGLIYDCKLTNRILNPYAHFGQPSIWPRGYPLDSIKYNYNNSYISGKRRASVVQQGVVNGDPDVDAIFRLTKSMSYKKIDIKFDDSSPSLQIPLYKMSPYNSQNTLISYSAFWSLYLPNTVSFRLTDIWRSYWSQRLMWLINETVTFNGPNAFQLRNSHSYLKDFEEEKSMYSKTESLIRFLYEWKCSSDKFYNCVVELSEQMAKNHFWESDEVISIKNWIGDLNTIGYLEPKIINFEHNISKPAYLNECSYKLGTFDYSKIRYTPKFQKSIEAENYCCEGKPDEVFDNLEKFNYFENVCDKYGIKLNYSKNFIAKNSMINSKVKYSLLITFNHLAIDENIKMIQHIFSGYFQNIIFCGFNITSKLDSNRGNFKKFDSYSFIELNVDNGGTHYYCMVKAIEMNYKTDGYLLISDDVFLKYWNLNILDPNKIWFPFKLELKIPMDINIKNGWVHWYNGVRALSNVWNTFRKILNDEAQSETKEKTIIRNYLNMIENNQDFKTNFTKITFTGSDIFYLPKKYFESFHHLAKLYRLNNVFLEIAVPNLLAGLDFYNSIETLQGKYTWSQEQLNFNNYSNLKHFYHPFKLSKLNQSNIGSNFCKYFINDKLHF